MVRSTFEEARSLSWRSSIETVPTSTNRVVVAFEPLRITDQTFHPNFFAPRRAVTAPFLLNDRHRCRYRLRR
ncbi:hypothetical protein KPH14_009495 [Odynerus spinipes]|uniref:Uncharacterized protein n=1 Tax=Odynerus spinipes TaxID=1348599 RepID=A0AAD9RPZ2_9HYME|nr:hypothetical protein KPH14_009495 [Odynerus spinipes]